MKNLSDPLFSESSEQVLNEESMSIIAGGARPEKAKKEGETVPHSDYPDGDTGHGSQSCGCVIRDDK